MKTLVIIIMAAIISVFSLNIDNLMQENQELKQENFMLKQARAESIQEEVEEAVDYIEVEITHYTHTGNNTASGVYPVAGRTVACNFLPLGTRIRINGQEFLVEDTGGMEGLVVDVFVDTEDEAWENGRYTTVIEVLG